VVLGLALILVCQALAQAAELALVLALVGTLTDAARVSVAVPVFVMAVLGALVMQQLGSESVSESG
jgi:hypothetical protein